MQSPACHLCEDAQDVVRKLGGEYIVRHRPAMFPLVLVGGAFLSAGRLPRGKLRKLLKTNSPVGTVA